MQAHLPYAFKDLRPRAEPYKSVFDHYFKKIKMKSVIRLASYLRKSLLIIGHQEKLGLVWEIFGELEKHNNQCFEKLWRREGANIECAIIARVESLDSLKAALWSLEHFHFRSCAIALRPALELSQWAAALCMNGAEKAFNGSTKLQKKEISKVANLFGQAEFSYQLSRYTQHERFPSFYFAYQEGVDVTHVNRSNDSLFDDVNVGFWLLHLCLMHQVALFYVDSFFRMPLFESGNLSTIESLKESFGRNFEESLAEFDQWMKEHHAILPISFFEQIPT